MHTLFFGAYMGLGLTLAGQALLDGSLLEIPLICEFFLLSGMRFIFDLPAELPANGVFQAAGAGGEPSTRAVARKAMLLCALTPLAAAGLPISIARFGVRTGVVNTAFVALVCVVFTEVLLIGYRKIPFTCARAPGKRNPAVGFVSFCAGFVAFVSWMASLDGWVLAQPWRLAAVAAAAGALWLGARLYFKDWFDRREPVVFIEEREPGVRTLRIA